MYVKVSALDLLGRVVMTADVVGRKIAAVDLLVRVLGWQIKPSQ